MKTSKQRTMRFPLALSGSLAALLLGVAAAYAAPPVQYGNDPATGQPTAEQSAAEQPIERSASTDAAEPQSAQMPASGGNLQALADEHEDLSEFVQALETAGMDRALTGDVAYTVFAPTNGAFEGLEDSGELLQAENRDALIGWVRAHIVADDVDPAMATKIGKAQTVDGGEVTLAGDEENLTVNGLDVVDSDITLGNLRVYAIDGVLDDKPMSLAARFTSDDDEEEAE